MHTQRQRPKKREKDRKTHKESEKETETQKMTELAVINFSYLNLKTTLHHISLLCFLEPSYSICSALRKGALTKMCVVEVGMLAATGGLPTT